MASCREGALEQGDVAARPGHALLEVGWLLVALLIPLAVNLWAQQPFEPSKAALLRILVWAMAGLWLAGGLLERRHLWRKVTAQPLFWPATAVVVAQALATLFSVQPALSLWGSYERGQGWLTLLSYYLLFLLVAAHLCTAAQVDRLAHALAATAVPLMILGVAQALGWAPVPLYSDARSSVYATLGRANFLGAYLVLLLPLTLGRGCAARGRTGRLAAAALLAGELALIALTRVRGAWLAAGVALALFGLAWFWPWLRARGRRWQAAAVSAGALGLAGSLAVALWAGRAGGSTAARLTIWRALLPLLARRPLLGYGPDTLELIFPAIYPPQLVYYQGRGILVDRAHNLLLDWAVTTGALGVLALATLLAAFFVLTWRAAQRAADARQRALLIGCLAAVGGAVAGNLVSFDVTATATATALLLALGVGLARLPASQVIGGGAARWAPGGSAAPISAAGPARRWAASSLSLVIAAGIGWAAWQANVRPIAADIAARAAERCIAAGDWRGARHAAARAVAWWPVEPAHRRTLSWICLQSAAALDSSGGPEAAAPAVEGDQAVDPCAAGSGAQCRGHLLARAEVELLAARDLRPGEYRTWAALGELYGVWGNRWDAARLPLAHQAFAGAAALAPNLATLYTAWGMVDLAGGRGVPAAARFRRAVDLDATDGYAFTRLGEAELAAGDIAAATDAFEQAVQWAPDAIAAHIGLARALWLGGQPQAAAAALAQALALDPASPAALALRQEMNGRP